MNSVFFETFFFTVVSPPSVHMKPVNLLIHPSTYLCKKTYAVSEMFWYVWPGPKDFSQADKG